MKEKILMTSATGKTGYPTTVQLLKDGYPVKIYVRSRNKKALELEQLGAEIAIGELDNFHQLKAALSDVKRAYYCYPFAPNLLKNTKLFIQVAKECNLGVTVFMGQWLSEFDDQKSIHTRETREAYTEFANSGLNVIYCIPGYFAESTIFVLEFAVQLGLMLAPLGNGKNPAPSNEDLGLVVAALLKNPEPYIGQKLRPTGPVSLSPKEMAAVFAKVANRKVRYINIPMWMYKKAAFAQAKEFGLDAFIISQSMYYKREYQKNKFDVGGPTDVVRRVTGKDPDDYETIVRRYLNNSPYKKRSFSNWFSSMKKFMLLPFTSTPSIKGAKV